MQVATPVHAGHRARACRVDRAAMQVRWLPGAGRDAGREGCQLPREHVATSRRAGHSLDETSPSPPSERVLAGLEAGPTVHAGASHCPLLPRRGTASRSEAGREGPLYTLPARQDRLADPCPAQRGVDARRADEGRSCHCTALSLPGRGTASRSEAGRGAALPIPRAIKRLCDPFLAGCDHSKASSDPTE